MRNNVGNISVLRSRHTVNRILLYNVYRGVLSVFYTAQYSKPATEDATDDEITEALKLFTAELLTKIEEYKPQSMPRAAVMMLRSLGLDIRRPEKLLEKVIVD